MNERAGGAASGVRSAGAPEVITPDAVGLELPVATVGSRGIGWLLDALIWFGVLLVAGVMLAVLGGGGFVDGWAAIAVLLLLVFAWQFGYPIGFEVGMRGRTPGKAAMGLRVITVEGAPVGFRHAVIRALVGLFELPMTIGAPAVVSSLASRRGQRLGDLAAGTMVVRERRVGGAPEAAVFVPPQGLEDYTARLDSTSVGPATYALIRDTLRRAPGLPPTTRGRITAQVASHVAQRVTPPPPPGVPAEPWLWCVAASVQRRRQVAPATVATAPSQTMPATAPTSPSPGGATGPPPPAPPPAAGRSQPPAGSPSSADPPSPTTPTTPPGPTPDSAGRTRPPAPGPGSSPPPRPDDEEAGFVPPA